MQMVGGAHRNSLEAIGDVLADNMHLNNKQSMTIGTGPPRQHHRHSGHVTPQMHPQQQEKSVIRSNAIVAGRGILMLACFPRDSMLWFLGALVPPKARLLLSSSAWPARRVIRYLNTLNPSTPFSLQYFTCNSTALRVNVAHKISMDVQQDMNIQHGCVQAQPVAFPACSPAIERYIFWSCALMIVSRTTS